MSVNSSKEVLDSWKEIAVFLKRGVRTVQRWERLEGLPVHRHNHSKRSTVYGRASEIHAWIAKRENHNERENAIEPAPTSRPTRFASLTPEQLEAICLVARTQAEYARRRSPLTNAYGGKVQNSGGERNHTTTVPNNLSVAV